MKKEIKKEIKKESAQARYIRLQTKRGFKKGDLVTVLKKAKGYTRGWQNSWPSEMDSYVGHQFKVISVECYGVRLEDPSAVSSYSFPYFVLEKVEKKATKVEKKVKKAVKASKPDKKIIYKQVIEVHYFLGGTDVTDIFTKKIKNKLKNIFKI